MPFRSISISPGHGCIYFSAAWKTFLVRLSSRGVARREKKEEKKHGYSILIQYAGVPPLVHLCLQAIYGGADAAVILAPIDPSGNTPLQQWFLGSDERLYLNTGVNPPRFCLDYVNPAKNGAPLIIADVNPSDQTQMWGWNGAQEGGMSTFQNIGAGGYSIDYGTQVQVWSTNNLTPSQAFTMSVIPAFAAK